MDFRRFSAIAEAVVRATRDKLPPELRGLAEDVPVLLQRLPSREFLEEGLEEDILGLFSGTPHGAEAGEALPMPPQIFLFLENILDVAEDDVAVFREEVRLTYLHELGHYFGWDEEQVAAMGLE
ncbi:MAG: metallopeptidase family protein [Opitutaceae bacterium]|jgi:predicted Zn-dependent protease with MMP-like domain|nr:metallopeptidase family protein [Opitutaceae bacterium]